MPEPPFDVIHIGSASRDLTDADPRGWRLGGGVSYAALTTARLGLRTAAVIGVDRLTESAPELELLLHAGVMVHRASIAQAPAFRNDESTTGRVQTLVATASTLGAAHLPREWRPESRRAATAWSLVPVANEVSDEWAALPDRAFIALGWQGLLRTLVPGALITKQGPARSPLVSSADLIGVSKHDLPVGTNAVDLLDQIKPGASLVVTDGLRGGQLLTRDAAGEPVVRPYEAVRAARTVDPTGAGDVFLAALLAMSVRPDIAPRTMAGTPSLDLRVAATAASFVVEAHGLAGVPTIQAVSERLERAR